MSVLARMSVLLDPQNSSYREKLLEHIFVGELLRALLKKEVIDVEVLRSEVDSGGYDLAIECRGIIRHIQLKSSHRTGTTVRQKVHVRLGKKASGCMIWVKFDPDTLELGPFLWFGGAPGEPLPNVTGFPVAKHSKGNAAGTKAERPNIRVIKQANFQMVKTMSDLLEKLFGPLATLDRSIPPR